MARFLPADWRDVLTRVSTWLQTADEENARRQNAFNERFAATPPEPSVATPSVTAPAELPAKMRFLEEVSGEADTAAETEEDLLREHVERSERLRLRLADRLGRAIG